MHERNYSNDGATGSGAIAIGSAAMATGANAIALGKGANALADGATVIGASSVASATNATAVGTNATASASNSVALGAGAVANEANTVAVGASGNERRITHVAPGVNPTDAVNVSQLNAVAGSINSVARKAYAGVAGATALSMIPEVDPGKTIAVGIGAAGYQGYDAVALGFTARLTNNLKIRGGMSGSSAGYLFGGGVSYQW